MSGSIIAFNLKNQREYIMADEDLSLDEPKVESEEGEEGKGSKKKLIIIAAVVVLLLIAGAVLAYFLTSDDSEDIANAVAESEITDVTNGNAAVPAKAIIKLPKGDAIYISVPEPFLVNIKSGKRTRMMQIKIQFMVRNKQAEDLVKQHMPLIRNNMLDFFSLADATEVSTREGRNALKVGALETAQQVIIEQSGIEAIEMVLFTGFVVQ